tara:strand:- start:5451 stop:6305 length:855 start_codon:yes stop_codon:yes gene_type:complete
MFYNFRFTKIPWFFFEKLKINRKRLFTLAQYRKVAIKFNQRFYNNIKEDFVSSKSNYDNIYSDLINNGFTKIATIKDKFVSELLSNIDSKFDLNFSKKIKKSQIELVSREQLEKEKFIFKFLKNSKILLPIQKYFKSKARYFGCSIIGSNITNDLSGSQNFHLDNIEESAFRIMVLMTDVEIVNGPTLVINSKDTERIIKNNNYMNRRDYALMTDENLGIENEKINKFCGKKGDVFLLDTCNCFHAGGRVLEGQRIVLMATIARGLSSNFRWMYNGKYSYGAQL